MLNIIVFTSTNIDHQQGEVTLICTWYISIVHDLQIPILKCNSKIGPLGSQTPDLIIETRRSKLPYKLHLLTQKKNNK